MQAQPCYYQYIILLEFALDLIGIRRGKVRFMKTRTTLPKLNNLLAVALVVLPLLAGCMSVDSTPIPASSGSAQSAGAPDVTGGLQTLEIPEASVPLSETTTLRLPTRPGTKTYGSGSVSIDASNLSEGYFSIRYTGSSRRVKVQIALSGGITYTQDLRTDGTYEVFPFTQGSGSYTINVFENVRDQMYTMLYGTTVTVTLSSSTIPFLYPNQYVNYGADSAVVKKAVEQVASAETQLAKVEKVYNFVIGNIKYDRDKAATVQSGYIPAVDNILALGKGICFDYGSVMATMLRSQGIPTRLEIGYVSGGAYHAWISVYTPEAGWVNGVIQFDGKSWKLMDPTFASSGNSSSSIMKYIGDGKNYSTKFYY